MHVRKQAAGSDPVCARFATSDCYGTSRILVVRRDQGPRGVKIYTAAGSINGKRKGARRGFLFRFVVRPPLWQHPARACVCVYVCSVETQVPFSVVNRAIKQRAPCDSRTGTERFVCIYALPRCRSAAGQENSGRVSSSGTAEPAAAVCVCVCVRALLRLPRSSVRRAV